MNLDKQQCTSLEVIIQRADGLKKQVAFCTGKQINSVSLQNSAKNLVNLYFKDFRPGLVLLNLNVEMLDKNMQFLFGLANRKALKTLYLSTIKVIKKEVAILQMNRLSLPPIKNVTALPSDTETKIIKTLNSLLPSLGLSYQQAIDDLCDNNRTSYRGTTAELREILRELLDHLATDADVIKEKWFKPEPGTTAPTMKQKVYFILKARSFPRNGIKVTEDTTTLIEKSQEEIALIARSAYVRGSIDTHTNGGSQRSACKQFKMYVDSVLCEILAIHSL